jgi:hypothetical protein
MIKFFKQNKLGDEELAECDLTFIPKINEIICFESSWYIVTDVVHIILADTVYIYISDFNEKWYIKYKLQISFLVCLLLLSVFLILFSLSPKKIPATFFLPEQSIKPIPEYNNNYDNDLTEKPTIKI